MLSSLQQKEMVRSRSNENVRVLLMPPMRFPGSINFSILRDGDNKFRE